ncbi:MAG: chromate resistance protein [Actinomycetota bacterium]|nr:chromate resistance protein [Actinomycetota bacterium]
MRGASATGRWVLLVYRLPREPSTPRISVWRKLKRLGVAQLADGLVTLPLDARNREQLEWIAEEVIEAGGEATVWLGEPASLIQEQALVAAMAEARGKDYEAVAQAAERALHADPTSARRTLERLRREMHRIALRDYFPPPQRQQARAAVRTLADSLASTQDATTAQEQMR